MILLTVPSRNTLSSPFLSFIPYQMLTPQSDLHSCHHQQLYRLCYLSCKHIALQPPLLVFPDYFFEHQQTFNPHQSPQSIDPITFLFLHLPVNSVPSLLNLNFSMVDHYSHSLPNSLNSFASSLLLCTCLILSCHPPRASTFSEKHS